MKTKHNPRHELAFSSPFMLHNCISRLRSLCKRHEWRLEIHPLDGSDYFYQISTRKYSDASGYLQRQRDGTWVAGTQSGTNWLYTGLMAVCLLAFIPVWLSLLAVFLKWASVITRYPEGLFSMDSLLSMGLLIFAPLGALSLTRHCLLEFWRAFQGPAYVGKAISAALNDSITDLPHANALADEDGELVFLEDILASANERSGKQ
jgi:hypothetical protein